MRRPLLVVAVTLVAVACAGAPGSSRPAAAVSVEATAPRGAVDWPFAFAWKGNIAAGAVCRVSLYDTAERELLERDTRGRELPAPEDVRQLLPGTRRFLWRVAVLDESGNAVAQSPLVEFHVR